MQNTRMAARKDRAGTTTTDNPADDHIVGILVKARPAMTRYAEAMGAHGQTRIGGACVRPMQLADLADAARKIMLSRSFDHANSCSSENARVIVDAICDEAVAGLGREGG